MGHGQDLLREMRRLGPNERRMAIEGLGEGEARRFEGNWPTWAHKGQVPEHDDWRVWVMLAGRGFGKTRAGAEWVSGLARAMPEARIALVAANADEARAVMIEGRSGLIAAARAGDERDAMRYEPSLGRLRFASGAEAYVYSGANPEKLRGPEHHFAWCDELAKWTRAEAAWDNLTLGLRLGARPRTLVTTTPKPVTALRRILALKDMVLTGGASRANPHLPEAFIAAVEEIHSGTRFGRQELEGVMIEDVEGTLWKHETIEKSRTGDARFEREFFERVVIAVDPPASAHGDACGIIVVGLGEDEVGYVLADHSESGLSPEGWARKVAAAVEAHEADRVVAESNIGGEMIRSVLEGAGLALPARLVRARQSKGQRAEPVATLFESGKAKLAGDFPELEEQLAGMTRAGYEGPGRSPDRADAMVWALDELVLRRRAMPRVRRL